MAHQKPSMGALAGVREDLKKAKEAGGTYDPTGAGAAWTHNFLNQKPWHPSNFRNRMKTWETEQKHIAEAKEKEKAQAEFDAEQEYLKTLSFLSPEQQQRYKDRQSISFMYQKPPGYDAAMLKDKEAAERKQKQQEEEAAQALAGPGPGSAAAAAAAAAAPPGQAPAAGGAGSSQQHLHLAADPDKIRLDPFKVMLQAKAALQNNERFDLKAGVGVHGGYGRAAENQQLLEDELPEAMEHEQQLDEAALLASLSAKDRARVQKRLHKLQEKEAKEAKLREAEAVLRAAGYNLDSLPGGAGASSSSSSASSSASDVTSSDDADGQREGAGSKRSKRGFKVGKKSKKKKKKSSKGTKHKKHKKSRA